MQACHQKDYFCSFDGVLESPKMKQTSINKSLRNLTCHWSIWEDVLAGGCIHMARHEVKLNSNWDLVEIEQNWRWNKHWLACHRNIPCEFDLRSFGTTVVPCVPVALDGSICCLDLPLVSSVLATLLALLLLLLLLLLLWLLQSSSFSHLVCCFLRAFLSSRSTTHHW